MRLQQSILLLFISTTLFFISHSSFAQEDEGKTYIEVRVDGLSCPFCAYGLEKKLKKLKGSSDLYIALEQGVVQLSVPKNEKPTEDRIRKIVTDAGFTAREIKFSETPFKRKDEDS